MDSTQPNALACRTEENTARCQTTTGTHKTMREGRAAEQEKPSASESTTPIDSSLNSKKKLRPSKEYLERDEFNQNEATGAPQSDGGRQMPTAAKRIGTKRGQIVGLACDESVPTFSDRTMPVPAFSIATASIHAASSSSRWAVPASAFEPVLPDSTKRPADIPTQAARYPDSPPTFKRQALAADFPFESGATAANGSTFPASAPVAAPSFLEAFAPYLTYNWAALRLGTANGTAAWNAALRGKLRRDPSIQRVPQVTPLDALQWTHRLQAQSGTVPPHPRSDLRKVLRAPKWVNEREAAARKTSARGGGGESAAQDGTTAASAIERGGAAAGRGSSTTAAETAFLRLAGRVLQDCVLQDVTDHRQEYQCLRPAEVVDRMRLLERRADDLRRRELEVMKNGPSRRVLEKLAI